MNFEGLNQLWNSGTTEELLQFYSEIPDVEALMAFSAWRKERATKPNILETGGSDGTFASVMLTPEISEEHSPAVVFRDSTEIFVTGRSPFFNESHFFNCGIGKALDYDPKWIVLMSDDLWEVTPAGKLSILLREIDEKETDTVWIDPRPTFYHSYGAYLAKRHPLEARVNREHHILDELYRKFSVETVVASERPITKPLKYYVFNRLFPRPKIGPEFRMTSDFCILSAWWCRKQEFEVLDESCIGWEDMDLSMRLMKARSKTIDFRIGSEIGGTIKIGMAKALKALFNEAVFNHHLRERRYGIEVTA